jgi:hypothetical protein
MQKLNESIALIVIESKNLHKPKTANEFKLPCANDIIPLKNMAFSKKFILLNLSLFTPINTPKTAYDIANIGPAKIP